MKRLIVIISVLLSTCINAQPLSQQLAATAMKMWPDSFSMKAGQPARWSYDQGVILKGIEGIWNATGDPKWFNYIQKSMDFYVSEDGNIKGYKHDEYNLDHLNNGKLLLLLYRVTGKEKYRKAADMLREQLKTHPRTSEGGFWHKKVYPAQMWLDGLYMAEPFYAEYSRIFHDDTAFNDITKQFILAEKHTRDPKTGLLYHGWDESHSQKWADKTTGRSPNVWGRAMGWYGMALVDVLDNFPINNPGRDSLVDILQRFAEAVSKVQDSKNGLWYDIADKPYEQGNYTEASASCMLVYTLAKGMRMGYLPQTYLRNVLSGYAGIKNRFLVSDSVQLNLKGTVSVSGLGGNPYRDGSYAYYLSEPVVVNDPKGMGAFILAADEIELIPGIFKGNGKTVLLDTYFNNEWKKDATGAMSRYHYTWDDKSNSGFSMLGEIFRMHGVRTGTLETAPSTSALKGADIFIIVDPDTEKETASPNYMNVKYVETLVSWVKNGGVLILMTNDAGNAELQNFNLLSSRFGIRFNEDNFNMVTGNQYEQGAINTSPAKSFFSTSKKIYIKELSTLQVNQPAVTLLAKDGKSIIATSRYGKGVVFAVGDPWLYNEYVDGRKLPLEFENYKAAHDLVRWAIAQSGNKK
ncbi:MAG: glycoside hydrolase family 88 protein [Flavisolibacter sp.]